MQTGSFINRPKRLHVGLLFYKERCSGKFIVEDVKTYPTKSSAEQAKQNWIKLGYKGTFIKEIYLFVIE